MEVRVNTQKEEVKFMPLTINLTFKTRDELYSFMSLLNYDENKVIGCCSYKGNLIKGFTYELWDKIKEKTREYTI